MDDANDKVSVTPFPYPHYAVVVKASNDDGCAEVYLSKEKFLSLRDQCNQIFEGLEATRTGPTEEAKLQMAVKAFLDADVKVSVMRSSAVDEGGASGHDVRKAEQARDLTIGLLRIAAKL